MEGKEVNGTYGSNNTPCTVFVATDHNGLNWYCAEGSGNINATWDDVEYGVDIEELRDSDTMTSNYPINSIEELLEEMDR